MQQELLKTPHKNSANSHQMVHLVLLAAVVKVGEIPQPILEKSVEKREKR